MKGYLTPFLCSVLFGFRILAIMQSVKEIGAHLAVIEKHFDLDAVLGWERKCLAAREAGKSAWITTWQWAFWIVLIVVNLLVGLTFALPCSSV